MSTCGTTRKRRAIPGLRRHQLRMVTADLNFGGEKKHVIIQPSKNGMIYVIEAKTGKLHQRRCLRTEVTWNTGIDMKTGRPIEVPGARYENEPFNVSAWCGGRPHLASRMPTARSPA